MKRETDVLLRNTSRSISQNMVGPDSFWLHKRGKAELATFVPGILYITWLINQQMARVEA